MIEIEKTGGGMAHVSPFIGPTNHTVELYIAVNTLTTKEVDVDGRLKPGVVFDKMGNTIARALSTIASPIASSGNTGNGTVGSLLGKAGGVSEIVSLLALSPTSFAVFGSRSGRLANATVGTAYTSAVLNFTLTAGATAFTPGDRFDLIVSGSVDSFAYGVHVEAAKIVKANPTDASLAADTRKVPVAVATIAQVNRSIARDTLGRDYTAAEIASFEAAGSKLVLSPANTA